MKLSEEERMKRYRKMYSKRYFFPVFFFWGRWLRRAIGPIAYVPRDAGSKRFNYPEDLLWDNAFISYRSWWGISKP